MTKEELKTYRTIKAELTELNLLAEQLGKHIDADLQELYEAKKGELTAKLQRIEQAIATLNPTERRLMRLRYIECLSWNRIANKICYSWQQTHRIHAKALIKLQDK